MKQHSGLPDSEVSIIQTCAHDESTASRPTPSAMWINEDRVLYVGLLGHPTRRTFGAHSIYLSLNASHRVSLDGNHWVASEASVIPPYVPHWIACSG